MIELNGRRLGLDDELARDYEAFHDAAPAIDFSGRGRMRFTGAAARGALNGILTCDSAPLASGDGGYGALPGTVRSGGASLASRAAAESARIEAGRPLWGIDMDESTLAQEVNLEALGAVSFTKGCYTGQEVVARLHFRGHVNRRLMGLRVEGATAPTRGSELTNLEGASCGDVRSSIVSPRFGPIALGMVRREGDAGMQVITRVDDDAVRAEVVALPFGG